MKKDICLHLSDDIQLDDLIEGVQLISREWRYLCLNKAAVDQSRYKTKEEMIGYTMMEKYPGIEKTEMFSALKACMENGIAKMMENEFTFADNSRSTFLLRFQSVSEGVFILSLDITVLRKGEMEKAENTLNIEEIISMISHKIRQPIAHILGISHLLEAGQISKIDLTKTMSHIKDSAILLDILTRELTLFIYEKFLRVKKVL